MFAHVFGRRRSNYRALSRMLPAISVVLARTVSRKQAVIDLPHPYALANGVSLDAGRRDDITGQNERGEMESA